MQDHSSTVVLHLVSNGKQKVQEGFAPLVEGFIRVLGDIEAIEEAPIHQPDIVAILVEPIQGEAGVAMPAPQGLVTWKKSNNCNQHNWLDDG